MPDPLKLMLDDLLESWAASPPSVRFTRVYDESDPFAAVYASIHEQLNQHFDLINDRARSTRHYWAENSRDLLKLNDAIGETLATLERADVDIAFAPAYRDNLQRCLPWLSSSGGSEVPENFELLEIIRHEPILTAPHNQIRLAKQRAALPMTLVGHGSYATVHSYVDPDYGIRFAVKRARRDLDERDLHRFRQEFDTLARLSFPYLVEVYRYDEQRREYRMEFCDETLQHYVNRRNARLSDGARKRIALQFLYGINYLHSEGLLHRDISLSNVLLKVYDSGAVLVKLSDFGLVKHRDSDFTRTITEMRGTIRDPALASFAAYDTVNEIYAVGVVLSFIFTGRKAVHVGDDAVGAIVARCTDHSSTNRYQQVRDVIADVEAMAVTPAVPSA